jgi:Protein of unknown function (DUF3455)
MPTHTTRHRCSGVAVLCLLTAAVPAAADAANSNADAHATQRADVPITQAVKRIRAAPLPSFAATPNIAAAVPAALGANPVVRALYGTESGFQVYRCDRAASGQPAWALRTPLAHLRPKALTGLLVQPAFNHYHLRSDLGGLVSEAEQLALGLAPPDAPRATAPVWQFTFTGSLPPGDSQAPAARRETVAGRVLASDTVDATAIPWLLIEVRGRAISTVQGGVTTQTVSVADPQGNPIAASEYLLRFNTRGGLAPAAALCADSSVGAESQQPYSADYYFVDVDPPTL